MPKSRKHVRDPKLDMGAELGILLLPRPVAGIRGGPALELTVRRSISRKTGK